MKRILAALALVAGYVVISSLCHYVLFPEPSPDPSFLGAPTGRLFGLHAYYPPPKPPG
jgi:hypothetical protein